MERIKLISEEWSYDPNKPLGPKGGFGEVFLGQDLNNNPVAVKKIKIEAEEASHREFDIAEELSNQDFQHVIPILDTGQDSESGSYFLVMPRAERSLQEYIDKTGPINDKTTCEILLEISAGLDEVPNIVHRDLKPSNVLYYRENWSIADFGIARFVEKATSLRTLKESLTPPYAAPEQWNLEKSSNATDIYALGCIGYFLLTGAPPFEGPHKEEFQDQHLKQKPPQLEGHNNRLQSLLHMMLRKSPSSRPSRNRIKEILILIVEDDVNKNTSIDSGLDSLSRAGVQVAQQDAEYESMKKKEESEKKQRKIVSAEGFEILKDLITNLFDHISSSAPNATRRSNYKIALGIAHIVLKLDISGHTISKDTFQISNWDVVAGAVIMVEQFQPLYNWSASLWYMRQNSTDSYRWNETSYFVSGLAKTRPQYEPFALTDLLKADEAASNLISYNQIAWGPQPIDDENDLEFFDRWAGLLAKGSQGQLSHPSNLPLPKDFSPS